MAYTHKSSKGTLYYLHSMVVKLKGSGKKQPIFWFSAKKDARAVDDLPKGYKVIHSRRTGLPLLKKA